MLKNNNIIKITIDASHAATSRSLAKIYAQVKGSKSYYDILTESGKVQTVVVSRKSN